MKDFLIAIENDLFDVADRLKEIDEDYRVFFNRMRNRYEVHNVRQRGNTFCLALPFDSLDARAVELVRKTRVENAERLFAEMEKQNAEMELKAEISAVQQAKEVYYDGERRN